ncbi:MAG: hypothetical protein RBT45_07800, partial [Acholeplasmataceae bacterium]|nr:hypothetical protein [Acholeplasmataceae bacterium]
MNLKIKDKTYRFDGPVALCDVAKDVLATRPLAATVNGRLRELSFIVTKDAEVHFLSYESGDSIRIYESTLRYVIAMAVKNLYPKAKIKFNYSISRSILAVIDHLDGPMNEEVVHKIKDEVKQIISKNLEITRKRISIGEATKLYTELDMPDKVAILAYREEDYVNMYECNGYIDYMFGYMLPTTGYLNEFELFLYHPGFIIQYPRAEFNGEIPKFKDEPTFGIALKEAAKWGKIIQGNTIPKINEYAKDRHSAVDFVNMCESKHNHQLNDLGTLIQNNIDSIRLIAIAGPSSSGKTTFSNRLRDELMTRGIKPVMISIDDYYFSKDKAPRNEDG